MRRFPVVKSEIVKAAVLPAKRKGNVLYSLTLVVIGAVLGAVCVMALLARPILPATSGPAELQPVQVGEGPMASNGTPTANYSTGGDSYSVVRDRSIPSLLQQLTSDVEEQREEAAYALGLALADYRGLDEIASVGGIPILRSIIENGTETNEDVLIQVITMLTTLSGTSGEFRTDAMQEDFFHRMVKMAKDGPEDVKATAANALLRTTYMNAMYDTNYNETLPVLVDLLYNGTDRVRERVTAWMRKKFVDRPGSLANVTPQTIPALLQVLKVGSELAKRDAAIVLAIGLKYGWHRKAILRGGGIPLLVPMLSNVDIIIRALLLTSNEYPETLVEIASVGLPILQRMVEETATVETATVDPQDLWLVSSAQILCVTMARDPQAAALMVQAGMLPVWERLSREASGTTKRQAGRIVQYLSRVAAAQDQSNGNGPAVSEEGRSPGSASLRREPLAQE
jgi:hypothetical protein